MWSKIAAVFLIFTIMLMPVSAMSPRTVWEGAKVVMSEPLVLYPAIIVGGGLAIGYLLTWVVETYVVGSGDIPPRCYGICGGNDPQCVADYCTEA